MNLLLITSVRNEAAHIARVVEAVIGQDWRPRRWVIVDDGSTDGTAEVASIAAASVDFIEIRRAPSDSLFASGLSSGSEARAFMWAVGSETVSEYELIGKLDGDVVLPPNYYRTVCQALAEDSGIGICGGRLVEPAPNGLRVIPIPAHHVHGAVKLYTRNCFESIGGIQTTLGWDTLDEAAARKLGYRTTTLDDLQALHLRSWGSRDGILRGRFLLGRAAYVSHYPLDWVLGRSALNATRPPLLVGGLAELAGFSAAALARLPRHHDRELRRFVQRELRRREVELVSGIIPAVLKRVARPLRRRAASP